MSDVIIYHNPRCSKSRATLALLTERGIEPIVIHYLDVPPTIDELRGLVSRLGLPVRELIRTGEEEYKTLGLADAACSDDRLLQAIADHPRLLQRPIVVCGERAAIGRPPEQVLDIL